MTVEEAIRRIRREAGRLADVRTVLEQVQAALAAPLPEEVEEMAAGNRPVSAEAHLLGALQAAIVDVENVEEDLRFAVSRDALRRLEEDWKRGRRPDSRDLRRLRSALDARRG
jgi:hypothetical protein